MKVAIIGSRSINHYYWFTIKMADLIRVHQIFITEIISGGALGVDMMAAKYAQFNNIPVTEIEPDWNTHGKSAGFIRNKTIIEQCDMALIFWDGESKGTKHGINLCKKLVKPYHLINYY